MAFNLGKYNLQAYDVAANWVIETGLVEVYETVTPIIGTASRISVGAILNERVTTSVVGSPSYRLRNITSKETVTGTVTDALTSIVLDSQITETVTSSVAITANYAVTCVCTETVNYSIAGSAKISPSVVMNENVSREISAGCIYAVPSLELYELINKSISIEAVDIKTCYIGDTTNQFILKPGDKLIIDANNYNVLLNSENAIWYQSGDWIDELDRETVGIEISAASGVSNLSATILYTERYL